MKNFLLALFVCGLSFGLTIFGLNNFLDQSISNDSFDKNDNVTIIKEDIKPSIDDKGQIENDSISKQTDSIATSKTYIANIDGVELENDYKKWYNYNQKNIEFSYEFTGIDSENNKISKKNFLNKLRTGTYIPLKVDADEFIYKLYPLSETADSKIVKSIKRMASAAYIYFGKEGEKMPEFNFTDLNGNLFNTENTAEKIKIIKCWFINCVVCVEEFPELNELYKRYEIKNNIVFFSLAFDKADKLNTFLEKNEFKYPVIANQRDFITKELNVQQYPTHIVVDEDNNIIKMVSNVKALITYVDYLIGSTELHFEGDMNVDTM